MVLNYKEHGSGKPLIILHGLFGSLDNWQTIGRMLGEKGFHVYLLDARNHGQSPRAETQTYPEMGSDLHEWMQAKGISEAVIIGHSMGGKTAMHFATRWPEKTSSLIIVDIAPKSYPPHHNIVFEGLKNVKPEELTSRNDAADILSRYLKGDAEVQFLLKNLYRREKDVFDWRFNLPVLEKEYEHLAGSALTGTYEGPTLVIGGKKSDYIIGSDLPEIRRYFPQATIEWLDTGHWVHAEAQEEFLEHVLRFIQ